MMLVAMIAVFVVHTQFFYEKSSFPSWVQFYVTTSGLILLHYKSGKRDSIMQKIEQGLFLLNSRIEKFEKQQIKQTKELAYQEKDIEFLRKGIKDLQVDFKKVEVLGKSAQKFLARLKNIEERLTKLESNERMA